MKAYFDSKFLVNPLYEYLAWLTTKVYYQTKYWGAHIRIGYKAFIRKVVFGKYNYIGKNTLVANSRLGNFTYIANDSAIVNTTIGKFCSIGPNVKIAPGRHPTSTFVSTHPSLFSNPSFLPKSFVADAKYEGNLAVNIGNDVWIGANCVIVDGITIADGAIIGANSVVTKNVEPYCVVGGTPAKLIKKRFNDEEIKTLLTIKWWDKDEAWIQQNINAFSDIKQFAGL